MSIPISFKKDRRLTCVIHFSTCVRVDSLGELLGLDCAVLHQGLAEVGEVGAHVFDDLVGVDGLVLGRKHVDLFGCFGSKTNLATLYVKLFGSLLCNDVLEDVLFALETYGRDWMLFR